MRKETITKYRDIQSRFAQLYKVERLRYDDCEHKVAEEFYISVITVRRILNITIEPMVVADDM
jgi:hypothetical protein